mgnify:CR=1 FL=1
MKNYVAFVSPIEALLLSDRTNDFIDMGEQAGEIEAFCRSYFRLKYGDSSRDFRDFCSAQALFNAGRIQGVREERSRRKSRASGAASPANGGTRKGGEDARRGVHPCALTTREKIKEAAEVLTDKQIRAIWKFMQSGLGIDDISVRVYPTKTAGGEEN